VNPLDVLDSLRELLDQVRQIHDLLDPSTWVANGIRQASAPLIDAFGRFVFSTGDAAHPFTSARPVRDYQPVVQMVANAGLAAVFLWGSYRIMWARSARSLYSVRALLPRALLAVILINFSQPLVQAAIDSNNALCEVVRRIGIPVNWQTLFFDWTNDAASGPGLGLLTLAALLLSYVVLAFAYVIRYALLVVLAITAPLAGLLFILPETHHYAKEWGALFISALLMQPLQLLILTIGFSLEADGNWPVRHLFALAALYLAFRVPGALHSSASMGGRAVSTAKRWGKLALHKGI
jgi:hypothetical protein